jgi:hypothetical protein
MGSLASLLRPASIAVIGASPRSFIGRAALENMRASGYRGPVIPVNPGHPEVGGFAAVADVRDLEAPVDVALVQVAAPRIAQAVDNALEAGIRNFVIPGAGHTDSGSLADVGELGDVHPADLGVEQVAGRPHERTSASNGIEREDIPYGRQPRCGFGHLQSVREFAVFYTF